MYATQKKTEQKSLQTFTSTHLCGSSCVTGDGRTASKSCDRLHKRTAFLLYEFACEPSVHSCR